MCVSCGVQRELRCIYVTHHPSAYPCCSVVHIHDLLQYVHMWLWLPHMLRLDLFMQLFCLWLCYCRKLSYCCTVCAAFLNTKCPFCQDFTVHIRSTTAPLHLSNTARNCGCGRGRVVVVNQIGLNLFCLLQITEKRELIFKISMIHNFIKKAEMVSIYVWINNEKGRDECAKCNM